MAKKPTQSAKSPRDEFNPSALRVARRARKLSVDEVSTHLKISPDRLSQFEVGNAQPSVAQLTRLSDLYNAPIFAFYGDELPQIEQTLPDFRKPKPSAADLSPKGLTRLWQVERRAKFTEEVATALGGDAPKTKSFARLTNKKQPRPGELRAGFDKWLVEKSRLLKFSGDRESIFQRNLRVYLEVHGCQTAVNTAPIDDYLGFFDNRSLNSRVIFINSEVKHEKRRLFTLSHEVAHFIFDEEGISNPFHAANEIERRCNAFAAEFLAPDGEVMGIVNNLSAGVLRDVPRLATIVAKQTLLSRQAATLRLLSLDVIKRRQASEFFSHLSTQRQLSEPSSERVGDPPKGRGIVVGRKLSEVGLLAAYTAARALALRLIDVTDIERGLGISEAIQRDVLDLAVRRFEAGAD